MSSDRNELGEGHGQGADIGQPPRADAQPHPEEGQTVDAIGHPPVADLGPLISAIRYWHRQRVVAMEQRKRADLSLGSFLRTALGWSKALPEADRKRINEQAKGLAALGEDESKAMAKGKPFETDEPTYSEWRNVILAFLVTRAPWDDIERQASKEMGNLARQLPVHSWATTIRGFGDVSLAIIVAEAGDLSAYPKKGHLWKRMGVAVMGDVRQGGLSKSAPKDLWIAHGYNRQRRSRMWNIEDALVKGNGSGDYRTAYLARKDYERARAEAAGLIVAPAAKIPARRAAEFMSDGHIHRRAQRYMGKKLLRDLWIAWRRASRCMPEEAVIKGPADEHRDGAKAKPSVPQGQSRVVDAPPIERKATSELSETASARVPTAQPNEGEAERGVSETTIDSLPSLRPKAA